MEMWRNPVSCSWSTNTPPHIFDFSFFLVFILILDQVRLSWVRLAPQEGNAQILCLDIRDAYCFYAVFNILSILKIILRQLSCNKSFKKKLHNYPVKIDYRVATHIKFQAFNRQDDSYKPKLAIAYHTRNYKYISCKINHTKYISYILK